MKAITPTSSGSPLHKRPNPVRIEGSPELLHSTYFPIADTKKKRAKSARTSAHINAYPYVEPDTEAETRSPALSQAMATRIPGPKARTYSMKVLGTWASAVRSASVTWSDIVSCTSSCPAGELLTPAHYTLAGVYRCE